MNQIQVSRVWIGYDSVTKEGVVILTWEKGVVLGNVI